MNWQRLWLGFLLPMTVLCWALGPGEEAAVVSALGRSDPGWGRDGGTAPWSHPSLPSDPQLPSLPFLPLFHDPPLPISTPSPCSSPNVPLL